MNFGDGFGCVGVEVDAGAMFERGGGAQELEADVDARRGAEPIWCGESHAAFQGGVLDAGEIYGGALACSGALGGFSAGLDAADAEDLA